MLIKLWIKGIKTRSQVAFYGRMKFFRHPQSKIIIGSSCRFRSDKNSNLAGINKRCFFSTLNANAIIQVGNNCGFSGTTVSARKKIIIEDGVLAGANTFIADHDFHGSKSESVHIRKNVWLGLNVIVLKGVTIGEGTIIGAGSVVVKDIPAHVIAGGNPCKVIKSTLNDN